MTIEDNTNNQGPEDLTPFDNSNVVSFKDFKKGSPASFPTHKTGEVQPVTATQNEPQERMILLNLTGGHKLVIPGFLAISGTFLAIGDSNGRIKFAAGPGMWEFATDVTGDADYDDREAAGV